MLQEIILVETLKLDDVLARLKLVHCLLLRLVGVEGSPIKICDFFPRGKKGVAQCR